MVVSGLILFRGLPLFCDATCHCVISANGRAHGSASNRNGAIIEDASTRNDADYNEVISSGLGRLLCLRFEFYGRMNRAAVDIIPELSWARVRRCNTRIQQGLALALCNRWAAIISCAVQSHGARIILEPAGSDIVGSPNDWLIGIADI